MENFEKHIKALELDKILHMLSQQTTCEDAASMALELKPQTTIKKVNYLLKQTDDACVLTGRFGSPSFGGAKNVTNPLSRARAGACLTTAELLKIAETLRVIRSLRQWKNNSAGVETSLDVLFSGLCPNKLLEDKITSCIIAEDEFADNASPVLYDIRRKIRTASSKAREVLDKIIHSTNFQKYLQDSIVTQRDGRYVVPVKAECRGNVPGLVHDSSSSGATVFIEPMGVVQANNDIRILKSKEDAEIERILFDLSASAGACADSIIGSYDNLVELNLIFAKAELAYKMKASLPLMNSEGIIDLKQARHPLIDKDAVVATDIKLGESFDTLMITGPNTGGKTVTLKTIGLFTLMAMCGLMTPCAEGSRLSVFKNVLADIGDEQSIEQSLSTFSSHMTNIIKIMKTAGDSSLILIDELGAGTDPVEGAALAISILEFLRGKGAKFASTTHYPELKEYALQTDGVENGCCEFDVATLKPTYRLLIGMPGKSNAFAISKRLGMKDEVISRAKELVSTENREFESVVQTLEARRQSLEKQLENAQRLTAKANTEKQKAENELKKSRERAEKEIELAKARAQQIIDKTVSQAESLMDELNKARKEREMSPSDKSKLRRQIKKMEAAADPVVKTDNGGYTLPRALKPGDSVLIYDIDKKATVLSVPDKDNNVLVQAGIIKTRVPLSNLRLTKQEKVKTTGFSDRRNVRSAVDIHPATEIDVRGQYPQEAIMAVDSAIDSAILANISQITVIHGKGTGVLRAEIGKHLKSHSAVKSFRLGVFGEGESGVTVIELK